VRQKGPGPAIARRSRSVSRAEIVSGGSAMGLRGPLRDWKTAGIFGTRHWALATAQIILHLLCRYYGGL